MSILSVFRMEDRVLRIAITALLLTLALISIYIICIPIYNVFLHPLRNYPGPKLWAATRIPYTRMYLSGKPHFRILELHKQYGPVVRVAPDTLSYSHPDAWKEIRGHRKRGAPEHGKDPIQQHKSRHNVLGANREDHARMRRALAHGFSAQAMLEQQPTIVHYVDMFIRALHEKCAKGTRTVDMVSWYNYTTFDIIGDLAFGEPFGCLKSSTYHPWVALVFSSIKSLAWSISMARYPAISGILQYLIPKNIATKWAEHNTLSQEKVQKRLETKTDRPDFISSMLQKRDSIQELNFEELVANSSLLIIAGSETTATALSAATYYLGTHPQVLEKLTSEVLTSFNKEEDINLLSVQKLSYMLAVLDETLRMYPPAPSGQPRRAAKGGDIILGQFVPENTNLEIWNWVAYHNPAHFTLPDLFIPERWLGDRRFETDCRNAFEPFSVGPRNCIGKNLAYSEMRLILARMIWNFEIKLATGTENWDTNSPMYLLWEKSPLNVYLTPRETQTLLGSKENGL